MYKKRRFLFCVTLLITVISRLVLANPGATDEPSFPSKLNPTNTPADGVIIKFAATASQTTQVHALSSSGLKSVKSFSLVEGLVFARIIPGQSILAAENSLLSNPNIEYVEPNYLVGLDAIPNDPRFSLQYGLNNEGQTGGITDADINAPEAWDLQTGNNVVIAVIDTGVDYTHSELQDNMWINPDEIPNNLIDDDGNGYIDDIYGWNFAANTNNPMDTGVHGTHVAGVIAAKANNGVGIAGINWQVKIMALKFIEGEFGSTADAIFALEYAVQKGVRISNNSWGGPAYSQALFDAIQKAADLGHLFVAAAGNSTTNTDITPHYPSALIAPNIISVAATDDNDALAAFSNYGLQSVDIGAPGSRIESTIPGNTYLSLNGTSMAAPFVAGAAGLVLSNNPILSVNEIIKVLMENADPIPALQGRVRAGRLNLYNVMLALGKGFSQLPIPIPAVISPNAAILSVGGNVQFSVSGGTPPYTWDIFDTTVAQIDANTGSLTAMAAGVTQVLLTDASGSTISTDNITVVNLVIEPNAIVMPIGASLKFRAGGGIRPYFWQSTAPSIGSIDDVTGMLQALALGRLTVSVTDSSGITAESGDVNIVATPLVFETMARQLQQGDVQSLSVSGGAPPYQWSVADTLVATIDNNGTFTAIGPGLTTVTVFDALSNSITSDPIEVNASMIMTNVPQQLNVNDSASIMVTGGVPPYQWRVTSASVANIDASGVLLAKAPGKVQVIVADATGAEIQSSLIDVVAAPVGSLQIDPNSGVLMRGDRVLMVASGGTAPYQWTVDNPRVAVYNPANGTLAAFGAGKVVVTVTDSAGLSSNGATFEVDEVMITAETNKMVAGATLSFTATGGTVPYQWSSSRRSVAVIDPSGGVLTAIMTGSVNVMAVDANGSMSRNYKITIQTSTNPIPTSPPVVTSTPTPLPSVAPTPTSPPVVTPSPSVTPAPTATPTPPPPSGSNNIKISPMTATFSITGNGMQFTVKGGTAPYTFSLSNPAAGSFTVRRRTAAKFVPNSKLTAPATTTIIVKDSVNDVAESGLISVR